MKKILFEGMSHMMGGLETFILTVYKNLNHNEYQCDFITYDDTIPFEEELKKQGSTIYKLPGRSKGVLKYRKSLDRVFEKGHYDVFWSNRTNLSSIYPFQTAKKNEVPIIICHSHQSQNMGSLFTLLMHKINRMRVGRFVTQKAACSEVAAQWFFGTELNTIILKNSVDTKAYDYDEKKAKRLKKENVFQDKFVIGHIGRFAPEKNHRFLIEIFEEILKQEKNAILLLCGDGEKRNETEQLVKSKNMEGKVKFLGIRKDIIDILHIFDVLIFPSLFEGLPFVLVEAQAAGLPCVVSDQVSSESKLTECLEFVNLERPASFWAQQALKYKYIKRKSSKTEIEASGFSINNLMYQVDEMLLK